MDIEKIMIVLQTKEGWEIIFQSAHGLLASQIGRQISTEKIPEKRYMDTLAAIMNHDDYQQSYEQHTYVTEIGAPRDFTLLPLTAKERYQQAHRVIRYTYQKSCWSGMLVSRHVQFLYGDEEEVSADMKKMVEQEQERRKQICKQMGYTLKQLEQTYQIMRFCDRCSLILCRQELPAVERNLEIITNEEKQRYDIFQRDDASVGVTPWPFQEQEFTVGVDLKQLTQLSFADDQELQAALADAKTVFREWHFRKK